MPSCFYNRVGKVKGQVRNLPLRDLSNQVLLYLGKDRFHLDGLFPSGAFNVIPAKPRIQSACVNRTSSRSTVLDSSLRWNDVFGL